MLCDKCKQNTALVRIQQNINGKVTEINLCEECAAITAGNLPFDMIFKTFMNSVMGFSDNFKEKEADSVFEEIKCPTCGLTYEGFKSSAKLGCADCYNAFRAQLITFFKSMHGSAAHTGKLPAKGGARLIRLRETEQLKKILKQHIEAEEFEEAAKIRDKIKKLTQNG